jgi:hypothetical protein
MGRCTTTLQLRQKKDGKTLHDSHGLIVIICGGSEFHFIFELWPIRPANEFYNVKVVPNEMTANRQYKRLRMP